MFHIDMHPAYAGKDVLIRLVENIEGLVRRMLEAAAERSQSEFAEEYRRYLAEGQLESFRRSARRRELDGAITSMAGTATERALLLVLAYATDRMVVRDRDRRTHSLQQRFHEIKVACPALEARLERVYTNALNPGLCDLVRKGEVIGTLVDDLEGIPFRYAAHTGWSANMEYTNFASEEPTVLSPFAYLKSRQDGKGVPPVLLTFAEFLKQADTSYTDYQVDGLGGDDPQVSARQTLMRQHEYCALDTPMNTHYLVAGVRFFARLLYTILEMAEKEQWFWAETLRERWWRIRRKVIDEKTSLLLRSEFDENAPHVSVRDEYEADAQKQSAEPQDLTRETKRKRLTLDGGEEEV